MSTNGQLVFTDVDKITFKGVGNASNAVIDTLTGKIGVGVDSPEANLHVLGNSYVSTNLELGGTLIMGTVNVESQHSLEAVTATGNITPLTVEFTNPTTSLVASGNVEVGGNVVAGYLYGDGSNITGISSNLDQIVNIGNVTSNTVQFTNPTTSLVASGNVEVGGDVVLSGNIYNNANLSVQYTTITPTLWTQVGQDIDGEAASDQSGRSVSMSSDGTRVAIGAPYNDANGSSAGHVRVFDWSAKSKKILKDDIVEVGGELTVSRNVNVSGKVTRTYNPGEIIEELNTVCNGRSVTVQSGTYTPTNVTARQDSTSTHTEINGSNITYNKPAGAKRIYYKFACQWNDAWAGAITAFKIRIYHNGSWRDIDPSRHAHAAQYRGDANNHGATWVINEYIFECDASSESQHDGRFTSSKTSYTFDVTWRHHGGAGSTAYNSVLHRLDFFDGNVANNPIHPPQLTIRAIA